MWIHEDLDFRKDKIMYGALTRRPENPGDHCIYHMKEWCRMCGACRQGLKTPDHKCRLELPGFTGLYTEGL